MRNFIIISIWLLLFGCARQENDLEKVRYFDPQNDYFKASLVSLHFMIETDKPADIDSVFNYFINETQIPVTAEDCANGIYTGKSPQDAFGFHHIVKLEIKDEKIINVEYDEINEAGLSKKSNKDYAKQMKKSGTTPAKAYEKMEKQLVEKQNFQDVDAVTGATYSLYRFQYAVAIALMKARIGI